MPARVKRLELTQLDDGRQQLLIEFDGEYRTRVAWYGELTADYLNTFSKDALVLDLHMMSRPASGLDIGAHWARLTVSPPRPTEPRLLLER